MNRRLFSLLLLACLFVAASPIPPSMATTITVDPGMSTLAINSIMASATLGEVVQFAPGTYSLDVPLVAVVAGVFLMGDPADPSSVVIAAPGTSSIDGDCFQVRANNVTISGFTLMNALSRNPLGGHGYMNAGIMVGNDGGDRRMDAGGEINVIGGTFSHNILYNDTVGIYVYRSRYLNIFDNNISYSNLADLSSGIVGAGILLYNEPPQDAYIMYGNRIERNTATHNYYAGIAVIYNDTLNEADRSSFDGTIISNNELTDNWYAGLYIHQATGPLTIDENVIADNKLDPTLGGGGDGLHILNAHEVYAWENLISDNDNYNVLLGSHVENLEFTGNTIGAASSGYGLMIDDEWGTGLYLPGAMTIHSNNFAAALDGVFGVHDYSGTLDLANNWWGDTNGPNVATGNPPTTYLGPGTVGKLAVWSGIAYDTAPWLTSSAPQSEESSTGSGAVTFTADTGALTELTAINPLPPNPPNGVAFPYGLFSFDIVNVPPGATVTITITFPVNLPSGTEYWKYQSGAWNSMTPTSIVDNVLTMELADGGTGDSDGVADGRIVDPGGPGITNIITFHTSPSTVGSITVAGHGTFTNGESTFLPAGTYTVTANPTDGYAFASWTSSSVTIIPTNTQSATLNARTSGDVTATFRPVPPTTITITVNTNPAGLVTPTGGGAYALGAVAHISVADVPSYTFQKWLRDGTDYSTLHAFDYTVDAPHTFTAVFQEIPPTPARVDVTFQISGLDRRSGSIITLDQDGRTPITLHGSDFPATFTWPVGSRHTVSVGNGTGTITTEGIRYYLAGWTNGGGLTGASGTYIVPDTDQTVTANFQTTPVQCTIVVNTSPSGLDSPTGGGTYPSGTPTTISARKKVISGVIEYTLTKWQKDGADYSTESYFQYTVDGNHTFTAVFQEIPLTQYTLTVNTSPSGLDSPTGGGTYNSGATTIISVGSVTGYVFQKWVRDGADYSTQQSFQYAVDANHVFTAMFTALPQHCITAACQVNFYTIPATVGSITFKGVQYTNGQSSPWNVFGGDYPVVANAPSGYTFVSWSASGVSVSPTNAQTATMHVGTNGDLTAIFNQTSTGTCTVLLNTNPQGLDNPTANGISGGGTFPTSTWITISVNNVSPYYFQVWRKSATTFSTQQTFQMLTPDSCVGDAGQLTLTADFWPEYHITLNTDPSGLDNPRAVIPPNLTIDYPGGGLFPGGTHLLIGVEDAGVYTFQKWQRDGIDYTTSRLFDYEVEATHTFTAVFQQAPPHIVPPSPCIIATAAYGSPMNPEVAYMRYVRDGMIGSTPTGGILRDGWNWFYYLWSPPVAAAIASSPQLQALFRILLLPLVGIIRITAATFIMFGSGNLAATAAFALAATLSTLTYVVAPALPVALILKRRLRKQY